MLLSDHGRGIAQIGTPASRAGGTKLEGPSDVLGGGRVMELLLSGFAQGFGLSRRVLKSRVVGRPPARSIECEVSQEDALEMADFAVLRQEDWP